MRELNIINDLLESKDYLSLEYFINKYSISKRTLQNEFSYLSTTSKSKGFRLIQKRGSGYLLEIEDGDKFNKFISELKKLSNVPKASDENIVAYISLKEEYTVTENLIKVFNVSMSTLKSYRKDVDRFLEKYNLKMERKAHYGLKIEESLKKRRKLLIDFYTNNNEIVKEEIDTSIENKFQDIQSCLINTLKKQDLIINYTELTQLFIWLKVTIYIHLKENTPLDKDESTNLIKIINERFQIGIGDEDIEEIQRLIKSKSRGNNSDEKYLKEIECEVDKFLNEIDRENNTSFSEDIDFKKLLITHVAALINRLTLKISYENPIIDEISIKYPMVFNIAIALGDMLKEKYKVEPTKDEIGFIATYFILHMEKEVLYKLKKYKKIAIVCSSGGGSSYLIKLKLESLFNLADIQTFSILQVKNLEEYKPDIIFSITNLRMQINVPIVYIKELLNDYDILNIKQLVMFEKFNEAFVGKTKEYYLKRFFNPMYFSIDDESTNYIECLKEMAKEIEEDGIGGEGYFDYVLKREEFAPTIYLNGIAIPHPIEMKGNEDLISIKLLKNPIIYKDKKVSIIFMVSLRKDNLEFHKGITNDLFEIMNNPEKVQALLKVKSFKEFIVLINKYKKV